MSDTKKEDELLKKRFLELAGVAYNNGHYAFTNYLNTSQLILFSEVAGEISHIPYKIFGGTDSCERQMVRFGSPEMFGYDEEFPIKCIICKPILQKFADTLSHRDFLGALMNLGIEREMLGDIVLKDNIGYIFCTDKIAEFLKDNLTKIKHTNISCEITTKIPIEAVSILEESEFVVSSIRCDIVVGKVFKLSRGKSTDLFKEKKVMLNSRLQESNSTLLKCGDVLSVRGFGKFIYQGELGRTKKDRISIKISRYV